jgi:hypothetical protein
MENKSMTEEEFYEQFEAATLDVNLFDHSNHVKMGWIYVKKFELPEAMTRFSKALKNFATVNGASGLYHETITFAYLILINERLKATETQQSWEEFRQTNPDLFDWKNNILKKYYREETVKSAFAKQHFVFPDRLR